MEYVNRIVRPTQLCCVPAAINSGDCDEHPFKVTYKMEERHMNCLQSYMVKPGENPGPCISACTSAGEMVRTMKVLFYGIYKELF